MARYPGAAWYGDNIPNQGGQMGPIRLGVMHIMSGTLSGTDSWFQNPNAQVSAHFGVGRDGTVHQYVDTDRVAWAEANYNGVAISIEHEGQSGDSLTPQQITADAKLYGWLKDVCGIPLVRNSDPNGSGWIGHGELGADGGGHLACPGQPILDQITTIIAQVTQPPVPPTPNPTIPGDEEMAVAKINVNGYDHIFYVDNDGVFNHDFKPTNGQWGRDTASFSGLLPNATPLVEKDANNIYVYIRGNGNKVRLYTQKIGDTTWTETKLP